MLENIGICIVATGLLGLLLVRTIRVRALVACAFIVDAALLQVRAAFIAAAALVRNSTM